MNIARFTPLRISSSEQEFILNFSLLEHDLIHFFKIRDFDHAISRINKFKEVHPIIGSMQKYLINFYWA